MNAEAWWNGRSAWALTASRCSRLRLAAGICAHRACRRHSENVATSAGGRASPVPRSSRWVAHGEAFGGGARLEEARRLREPQAADRQRRCRLVVGHRRRVPATSPSSGDQAPKMCVGCRRVRQPSRRARRRVGERRGSGRARCRRPMRRSARRGPRLGRGRRRSLSGADDRRAPRSAGPARRSRRALAQQAQPGELADLGEVERGDHCVGERPKTCYCYSIPDGNFTRDR